MKLKFSTILFSGLLVLGIVPLIIDYNQTSSFDENGNLTIPMDVNQDIKMEYLSNETILAKAVNYHDIDLEMLESYGIKSIEPLDPHNQSCWLTLNLESGFNAKDVLTQIRNLNIFQYVDFDYISRSEELTRRNVTQNTSDGYYIKSLNIDKAWDDLLQNGSHKGGNENVVAVIDTGVDYNHVDLKDNIWINENEIPNNNIDDDLNGYIDDYYGYNATSSIIHDPMDDNGHGTHVAGIIAAANNGEGITGVAYNSKIMVIKAGNSSGSFLQSDIAKAITYAYVNGANVINMSFGGEYTSLMVQDALKMAFSKCVLVASAGNDRAQNERVLTDGVITKPNYPAAYPYVVGVMSSNEQGIESSYTNFDVIPNNGVEYEIYAPGENITSTMLNNTYVTSSGTSMAAPIVSGIASLLISKFPEASFASINLIISKLLSSNILPKLNVGHTNEAPIVDAYQALNNNVLPDINLYNYYGLDNPKYHVANNGDNIVDAGELIHFGFEFKNSGGNAINTIINITSPSDKFVTIKETSLNFGNIGNFAIKDGTKIYEDGLFTDIEKYIPIQISNNCPNDYVYYLKFTLSYSSSASNVILTTKEFTAKIIVSSGIKLPFAITEDTTLIANQKYLLTDEMYVKKGVTLTIEEGVEIQYYTTKSTLVDNLSVTPKIVNYGTINFNGTATNRILVGPSDVYFEYICPIYNNEQGQINAHYVNFKNLTYIGSEGMIVDHCDISNTIEGELKEIHQREYEEDEDWRETDPILYFQNASYSTFDLTLGKYASLYFIGDFIGNKLTVAMEQTIRIDSDFYSRKQFFNFTDNVFVNNKENSADIEIRHDINPENQSKYKIDNNTFIYDANISDPNLLPSITFDSFNGKIALNNTQFIGIPESYIDYIVKDSKDGLTGGRADFSVKDNIDNAKLAPFVSSVTIKNKNSEITNTVGKEEVTFEFTFSKPMDINANFTPTFGSVFPYGDYIIKGDFINETKWVGKYKLESFIEGGKQNFSFLNGMGKTHDRLINNGTSFYFNIDLSTAHSMNLTAKYENGLVNLSWNQDDYETLIGYNIYRFDNINNEPVKLNKNLIPNNQNTYQDATFNPGSISTYYFTVVFSDFKESSKTGSAIIETPDTINPVLYHDEIIQGYKDTPLHISVIAFDNNVINKVTLFYKDKVSSTYQSIEMEGLCDLYSVFLDLNFIKSGEMEYYFVASDGTNEYSLGSSSNPYSATILDINSTSNKGDINNDGVINMIDATLAIQHISGQITLTNDQLSRADLDGNGTLESYEALKILQFINGKINQL